MPELPEVETIRRDLAARIIGRPISAVNLLASKTAKNHVAFFKKSLLGASFRSLKRRGKLLIFSFSKGQHLLIHLKMTGQLIYVSDREKIAGGHSLEKRKNGDLSSAVGGELPNRQTRAIFEFRDGGRLFFNDLRRFGYLKIVSDQELAKILTKNYGPEPLTPAFTLANFQIAIHGRRSPIKSLLLNQRLIAGLGNIYVDESLFAAGIRPQRPALNLSLLEAKRLWQAINRIIKRAVASRGTTFNNYVDAVGQRGNFARLLKVYGRGGEACPACRQPIKKAKISGRGTHYCPNCQK